MAWNVDRLVLIRSTWFGFVGFFFFSIFCFCFLFFSVCALAAATHIGQPRVWVMGVHRRASQIRNTSHIPPPTTCPIPTRHAHRHTNRPAASVQRTPNSTTAQPAAATATRQRWQRWQWHQCLWRRRWQAGAAETSDAHLDLRPHSLATTSSRAASRPLSSLSARRSPAPSALTP